jgi:hypothetical protein
MSCKMLEMCFDHRGSLLYDIRHHGLLIVGDSLTPDYADRAFRAGADAGAKAVAEEVAHEPGLSPDDLQRSLRAVRDALAASGAFLFIDTDDLAFHVFLPSLILIPSFWCRGI